MNRLSICIILLCFGGPVSAETLYQWTEADGSITFSPKKPPAGVEFKTIESSGSGKSEVTAAASVSDARTTKNAQVSSTSSSGGDNMGKQANSGGTQNNAAVRSNRKQRQCVELSKRVVSLERRLRSPLKPVDMDNTVIAMARYQRNYDQFCVE